MSEFKSNFVIALRKKDYGAAIDLCTKQLFIAPQDFTALKQRAAVFQKIGKFDDALEDSERIIALNPTWTHGFEQRGEALNSLGRLDEAIVSFEKAIELDKSNEKANQLLESCIVNKLKTSEPDSKPTIPTKSPPTQTNNPFGQDNNHFGNTFSANNLERMKSIPKFKEFFQDKQFAESYEKCIKDQSLMMNMLKTDPRYMEIFKELSGVDLNLVQPPKESESKQIYEISNEKELEEAEAQVEKIKKQAEEKKSQGNQAYKSRDFEKAIKYYSEAQSLNSDEPIYYTNLAAVYFEMKEYDNCINQCEIAVSKSKGSNFNAQKLCKALGRKANALGQQNKLSEAIETFQSALFEYDDVNIRANLHSTIKRKQELETQEYNNPYKSQLHNAEGLILENLGNYEGAIKEFNEAIKRDEINIDSYLYRGQTYMKLKNPVQALSDAEKCISLDSKCVKAYSLKASCHHFMTEYHKAIQAYDLGLEVNSEDQDLLLGKHKTLTEIDKSSTNLNDDRKALSDPEVQLILANPAMQQVNKY